MQRRDWNVTTNSAAATERLAEQIGKALRGGEVIELVSDLGGGKTTFVRGLARGMGSTARVSSPTFTLSQVYDAGDRALLHFDFYRLVEAGIMADELAESLADPEAVVVIEWGDVVADILPDTRITATIVATGEDSRSITFQYPDSRAYAIPKGNT